MARRVARRGGAIAGFLFVSLLFAASAGATVVPDTGDSPAEPTTHTDSTAEGSEPVHFENVDRDDASNDSDSSAGDGGGYSEDDATDAATNGTDSHTDNDEAPSGEYEHHSDSIRAEEKNGEPHYSDGEPEHSDNEEDRDAASPDQECGPGDEPWSDQNDHGETGTDDRNDGDDDGSDYGNNEDHGAADGEGTDEVPQEHDDRPHDESNDDPDHSGNWDDEHDDEPASDNPDHDGTPDDDSGEDHGDDSPGDNDDNDGGSSDKTDDDDHPGDQGDDDHDHGSGDDGGSGGGDDGGSGGGDDGGSGGGDDGGSGGGDDGGSGGGDDGGSGGGDDGGSGGGDDGGSGGGDTSVADIELDKAVDQPEPPVGSEIAFTLTATNQSQSVGVTLEVTDLLADGFTFVAATGSGIYDPATGIWSIADLPGGQTAVLTITATVNADGSHINEAEVTASSRPDPDSVPGDGMGDDYDAVVVTPVAAGPDTDGDGTPDADDLDDDNDGLPDAIEGDGSTDQDGDGIPDSLDTDADGDGIPDTVEAGASDVDGDGQIDGFTDTNGNGLDDRVEANPLPRPDSDGDGATDDLDIDSDADGLTDATEAGPTPNQPIDSDADGRPDYRDIDADGDGIVDNEEAQSEGDYVPPSGADTDADGLDDAYDSDTTSTDAAASAGLDPVDTDGSGPPDYIDTDTDADSVPDLIEGSDADHDGRADRVPTASDADQDGLDDAFDIAPGPVATPDGSNAPRQDTDADGTRDWRDADDDDDGLPTIDEDPNGNGDPTDDDTDGDGIPDYLDPANNQPVALPLVVEGVVFDAVTRAPIGGGQLSLGNIDGQPLPAVCVGAGQQGQTPDSGGQYHFDIAIDADPACASEGFYRLVVSGPSGYLAAPSTLLPPQAALDPTGLATPWAVQAQATPPQANDPTPYHLGFTLAAGDPDIVNNHVPLDPTSAFTLTLAKRADRREASTGELVRYAVTVTNSGANAAAGVVLDDALPPGFSLVADSVRLDGAASGFTLLGTSPLEVGGLDLARGQSATLTYVLQIGAGVTGGRYRNSVTAMLGGTAISNTASATVDVVASPELEQATIIGKVFADADGDGWQDEGEAGIPGVRLATVTGLLIETDAAGRFHIAAEDVSNPARGRNFYLKLDPRSLPDGSRVTTENPRVRRITQGTLNRFDFGVALPDQNGHPRDSSAEIDLGDVLFEPTSTAFSPAGLAAVTDAAARLGDYDCGLVTITGLAGSCPVTVEAPDEYELTTQFAVLSDRLEPGDRAALDRIADEWRHKDIIRVTVTGYASSEPISARHQYLFADNNALSAARAESVARYIADALDIPDERVEAVGRGADDPIASNATEAGRILNRRAEIRIYAGRFEGCLIAGYDASTLASSRTLAIANALSDSLSTGGSCTVVPAPPPEVCTDCSGFVIEKTSRADIERVETEPDVRTAELAARVPVDGPVRGHVWLREDPAATDRRLAVTLPDVVALDPYGRLLAPVEYATLTNYPAFIERLELAIYRREDSDRTRPLARLDMPVAPYSHGEWTSDETFESGTALVAVLRAYGADGAVDEAGPVGFRLVDAEFASRHAGSAPGIRDLVDRPGPANPQILINASRVRVNGEEIPAGASVTIDGVGIPVDQNGRFATEYLVPAGHHDYDVTVTDAAGSTVHHLETDADGKYMFVAALADVTASTSTLDGAIEPLAGNEQFTDDQLVEGRLALYLKGKIKGRFLTTAQLDTGEAELSDLVDQLGEKDPRALFRHLDPDRYYPVYGDDSTTIDDTDSLGRFYVRVDWDRSQALWGNYNTNLTDTEFAQYNRSLYGAELEYASRAINQDRGESRATGTVFASPAQTALAHDEFLGTGGSLYYLRNADVVYGSEKVHVEVRDRDSERVIGNVALVRGTDYEIDELNGRITLAKPLSQVAFRTDGSIVRDQPLDGDRTLLLVDYEYVPTGFDSNNLTAGGRGTFWAGDHVRLGSTLVNENRTAGDYQLAGVDLTLSAGAGTYLKLEGASTESSQANVFSSDNGGLSFTSTSRLDPATGNELTGARSGDALGIEGRIDFRDLGVTDRDWTAAAWRRRTDAGFSIARRDLGVDTTESGFELAGEIGDRLGISAHGTTVESAGQRESKRVSIEIGQREGENRVAGEIRRVDEQDLVAGTDYAATLAALRYTRTINAALDLYALAQTTVDDDGGAYADNDLVGIGARARVADRTFVAAEIDDGDRGRASQVSIDRKLSADRTIYGTYTLSADRTDALPYREQFAVGQRSRISNQADMFAEMQFVDDDQASGLAHVFGLDFGTGRDWGVGFSAQQGKLEAQSGTVDRDAFGITGAFEGERWQWRSAFETRRDAGAEDRRQVVTSHRIDRSFNDAFRLLFRLNLADTSDNLDALADARFVEGSIGLAYRPTTSDRFNWLARYTVLEDLPSLAQTRADPAQRSSIFSFDSVLRLNPRWDLGAKLATRTAEVRDSRAGGDWYRSDANLGVLRGTYHVLSRWDALLEYRALDVDGAGGRRTGFLAGIDRHLTDRIKLGIGYNFTDFSDDLSVLDYDRKGWFLNFVGKY